MSNNSVRPVAANLYLDSIASKHAIFLDSYHSRGSRRMGSLKGNYSLIQFFLLNRIKNFARNGGRTGAEDSSAKQLVRNVNSRANTAVFLLCHANGMPSRHFQCNLSLNGEFNHGGEGGG